MAELRVNMTIVNNDSYKLNDNVKNVMMLTFAPSRSYLSEGQHSNIDFEIGNDFIDINALRYLLGLDTNQYYGIIAINYETNTFYISWNSITNFIGKKFELIHKGISYYYEITANNLETFASALALGNITLTFTTL